MDGMTDSSRKTMSSESSDSYILRLIEKTGRKNIRAMTENIRPQMVPTANENQNTSDGPSKRNGISPSTVESTVRLIGHIFMLKALQ